VRGEAYVLRYWEQEFTQLRPMKRRGNRRYYQHHEVLLIRRIRELLYDQGFTISGARNRLIEGDAGVRRPDDVVVLGLDVREPWRRPCPWPPWPATWPSPNSACARRCRTTPAWPSCAKNFNRFTNCFPSDDFRYILLASVGV
jgi:hypothetical protein